MVQKKEYRLSCLPFDIKSHPTRDVVAVSTIEGEIHLLSSSLTKLDSLTPHSDSCRRILFSGDSLYSISSDKSLVRCDVETRKVVKKYSDAHEHSLYALCEVRDGNVFATGDDEGEIKLWDMRKEEPIVMVQPEHDNFISSLSVDSSGSTLLASSGDGRLSVWNSRQRKLIARSDECDSELLTCDVVRSDTKVVCGDAEGVLNVFSWDDWGDITDRVPIQEEVSIDCALAYAENVLILGCMDGLIRATALFPHTPLPHIGDHSDNPIEGICMSTDESEVLSIGHDYVVRAWQVNALEQSLKKLRVADGEDSSEEEEEDEESEEEGPKKKKLKHITSSEVKKKQSADFFSDLA